MSLRHKAQMSVEYIIIISVVMVALLPGLFFIYQHIQGSNEDVASTQYNLLGQEILSTAEKSLSQGEGSWLALNVNVPSTIQNINISESGSALVFSYQTSYGLSEVVFFTDLKLSVKDAGVQTDGTIYALQPHGGKVNLRFTSDVNGTVAIEEVGS